MAPRKRSSVSAPLMFAVIVVSVIFIMSVAFRVSDIQVNGNVHYTDLEIINAIEVEEGDNLFFFDRFAAVTRVFAKLPYVQEVSIERALPNKMIINVSESNAIAFLRLGAELWTMDEKCKILGTAAEGEEEGLIPIVGFNPGTLFINETITTADNSDRTISYLKEILNQIYQRGIAFQVSQIDFTEVNNVKLSYAGKYTVNLGDPSATEHKFSMLLSAVSQLKDGDIGIIDLSDGSSAHFRPF